MNKILSKKASKFLPAISVIVCTYNREKLLRESLNSLVKQTLAESKYEIIVVDNGSTDGTSDEVRSFRRQYPQQPITYLYELKEGLSTARNNGYKNAKAQIVAFIDDDAKVGRDWLKKIYERFQKMKTSVIAIGGPIIPYYNFTKPVWFKDEYESDWKGDYARFLRKGESFSGSNMVWKKKYLYKFGGFNESIGMSGNKISIGEETALFEKIWRESKNKEIFYYFPDLPIYHLVTPEKLSLKYRLLRWFTYGQSLYVRSRKNKIPDKFFEWVKVLGYFLLAFFSAIFLCFKYRYYQNWVIERLGPLMFAVGYFTSMIGLKIRPRQRYA